MLQRKNTLLLLFFVFSCLVVFPQSKGEKKLIKKYLKETKNLIQLKDKKGTIDEYIHYERTEAHSQYHQVFWIYTENKIIFYG